VDVKCKTNGATAPMTLQLVDHTGTPVGNTKSVTVTSAEAYLSAGGPTDVWGANLTPANLTSASFGVRLRLEATPGTLYASSVVSSGSWTSPTNALGAPDGGVAYHSVAANGSTADLWLGYGFPTGSYTGTVTVTARVGAAYALSYRVSIYLYEGGTVKGSRTNDSSIPTLHDEVATFANVSFTNLANLRVMVDFTDLSGNVNTYYVDAVKVDAGQQNVLVSVDHVRLLVTTGTQARKLYVGGGAQLVKVDLGGLTVDSTTTFTHGEPNMAPSITDIVAIKDGADPYGVAPAGLQGPVLAVCFG